MARKVREAQPENHERWLVAFADMMTLLFALFVVLYAIATVNTSKLKQVSESFQGAIGVVGNHVQRGEMPKGPEVRESIFKYIKGNTTRKQTSNSITLERSRIISAQAKKLEQRLAERFPTQNTLQITGKPLQDQTIHVVKEADGIRITMAARNFFELGEAKLKPDAKKIIDVIADSLHDFKQKMRVEGHTDNILFSKKGMTNWELSSLRAVEVTKYLLDTGEIPKENIYAAGFADTRPVANNETADGRAMNRRVDIKILYEQPEDFTSVEDHLENQTFQNK